MSMSLTARRIIITLTTAIVLLTATAVAIFWARGFKLNPQTGISRTGLIVAKSTPEGAKIFLDDKLISATNTTISFLEPKTYKIKITKDGFTTWEKDIEVKADLISEIKALLFPLAPELKPLTLSGASNPELSPDGQKIAYSSSGTDKGGIWVNTMTERPLNLNKGPRNIVKNTTAIDFESSKIVWSPSSDQILVETVPGTSKFFLFDISRSENIPTPISQTEASEKLIEWQDSIRLLQSSLITELPESVQAAANQVDQITPTPITVNKTKPLSKTTQTATSSAQISLNYFPFNLKFSPDEEKVLYRLDSGTNDWSYRIYDTKLKKELIVGEFDKQTQVDWFPDSEHLIIVTTDGISIIEADGSNRQLVFSGNFTTKKTAIPWPDGSKIVIEANFNPNTANQSNLYTLILK